MALYPYENATSQALEGRIMDASSKQCIPFVKLENTTTKSVQASDPQGYFRVLNTGKYKFSHPLFIDTVLTLQKSNDTLLVELAKRTDIVVTNLQHELGEDVIHSFHKFYPETRTSQFSEFDFLSSNKN